MKDLYSQFTDWVKSQPAEQEYDYGSFDACAMCQFLEFIGVESPTVGGDYWRSNGVLNPMPRNLIKALVDSPWTFGALAERLSPQPCAEVERPVPSEQGCGS